MEQPPEQLPSPTFPPVMPPPQKPKRHISALMVVALVLVGLLAGSIVGYAVTYQEFNSKLVNLQSQIGVYQGSSNSGSQTYLLSDNVSLSSLYQQVKPSVVVIQDLLAQSSFFGGTVYSQQQGSGFVTTVNNQQVIVTNNHVVQDASNVTVTFSDGSTYPAKVLGEDPLADLAVLLIQPMPSGVPSLTLGASDNLQIGAPVVAVGTPYGLTGTLTTGVISALGRTITESSSTSQNGLSIPDTIQTSTAINPGNSGGPLITYRGIVIGITTAGISNSQSLGFAIPSDTILRELVFLVNSGSYNQHPSINAQGTDMTYQIAQAMGAPVTYGWLVESVSTNNGLKGGNTQTSVLGSQVVLGGDIIVGINGARITNTDDLLSYLEEHTLPGQSINFTVIRNRQQQTVSVTIGKA